MTFLIVLRLSRGRIKAKQCQGAGVGRVEVAAGVGGAPLLPDEAGQEVPDSCKLNSFVLL